VTVQTPDETEHEVFLKVSHGVETGVEGLANELLAACLAGDLGLPICEPILVEMRPEWVEAISDEVVRVMLVRSCLVGFGSRSAGVGWKLVSPTDPLPLVLLPVALQIMAFDAFIANDDRKPSNTNCLIKGDAFRIIDHEAAFGLRMKLAPRPTPWVIGNLERLTGSDGHIFRDPLQGRPVQLETIREQWGSLSDAQLDSYGVIMPAAWKTALAPISTAINYLKQVRDNIDNCLAELERVLR
jgi:hypothetical protein